MTWTAGAALGGGWMLGVAAGVALLPGRPWAGIACVVLAAAVAGCALVTRPLLVPLGLAAALLGVGRAELDVVDPSLAARAASLAGSQVSFIGTVAGDPRLLASGYEAAVRPLRLTSAAGDLAPAGNILVRVRGPGFVELGDTVSGGGRLALPADLPGFDRRAYLAAQDGAYLELAATQLEVVEEPDLGGRLSGLPGRIRRAYQEAVASLLPEPHASVLVGVVLGVRSRVPPALQQALVATGLVHLLVLSGLKVAVFTRLLAGALRPLLGRAALLPLLGLVGLYALAGGATPAALRAAAMGGLVAAGSQLGRPAHVWTSLAVVGAAMLAWRPGLVWDVGFQLSFVGTAAIVLLATPIGHRLGFLPGWFREPFAVTCAAQLGTLPLMATDFHLVSPVAPLANAAVLPLLPALVVGGLLLPVVGWLPEAFHLLALPVAGLLAYLEQVAYLLARVPAAAIPFPDLAGWAGLAYYAAAGGALLALRESGGRRLLAIALAIAVPLAVAAGELVALARAPASAAVLAVGDGDAVLLTGPGGHVLLDGGSSPARLTAGIGARLPPWERRLAGLFVTAAGRGQTGGLAGFDRTASVVAIPAGPFPGSAWRSAAATSLGEGGTLWRLEAGQSFTLAGLAFEVLAPEPRQDGDADPAALGLALRVRGPSGRSFCELGELDADGQLAAAERLSGHCDYLLLPSGARSAPPDEVMAAVGPSRLIASTAGGSLDRSLPASRVERTDQEGDVVLPL